MGDNLSTDITSPQTVAVGAVITGNITATSPSAGNFYLMIEQFTTALVAIPGSRAYLYQEIEGEAYVNNTSLYTSRHRTAADVEETAPVSLTVLNTDCLLYIFLKQRASNVIAGAFVVGTMYEIMSIGTTDFTLIGATANTVGVTFAATGVGVGTGEAAELPDPVNDDEIDYVAITLQLTAPSTGIGIDINTLITPLISIMIVVMMMKMMTGAMSGIGK